MFYIEILFSGSFLGCGFDVRLPISIICFEDASLMYTQGAYQSALCWFLSRFAPLELQNILKHKEAGTGPRCSVANFRLPECDPGLGVTRSCVFMGQKRGDCGAGGPCNSAELRPLPTQAPGSFHLQAGLAHMVSASRMDGLYDGHSLTGCTW